LPHCILEYTDNMAPPDFGALFGELHDLLVGTGEFQRDDIKSRARPCADFLVGAGGPDRGFAALEICILDGRSDELKSRITAGALELLDRHFAGALEALRGSLSARVTDMHRASYARRRS